ncbi:MAG: hypothetical protein A2504_16380 [Bdellovibrionales bacterium RIFOXYD12_FULL_39_22]|nr:MAG: hypothetical protein A2385_10035 [Bdellovibrionales bacterium RIFOXYB1_FULL_39_21]OFZ45440.1 MAG: hypothetical protein A2404_01280 [Bdellovibrionales bacterium RIFOXYC1_FULL_39_130]OFZ74643.1 MAG: hypothetical protein A2560_09605 [Bdellovibrionales bacterium RIFOXYD1_FULL_39_84]OFZ92952.1 MAG: hypothetical protein A2504_16380 [Bdellovibrionales bacterium RIFOXYD12_FULL_39_22]
MGWTNLVKFKNGFSILELVLALGLGSLILYFAIDIMGRLSFQIKKSESQMEIAALTADIERHLSRSENCTTIFAERNSRNDTVDEPLSSLGGKFRIGQAYNGVKIINYQLLDSENDEVDIDYGSTNLLVAFEFKKKTHSRSIKLLIEINPDSKAIVTCNSFVYYNKFDCECIGSNATACFEENSFTFSAEEHDMKYICLPDFGLMPVGWLRGSDWGEANE